MKLLNMMGFAACMVAAMVLAVKGQEASGIFYLTLANIFNVNALHTSKGNVNE